jgi:hypothetical protein
LREPWILLYDYTFIDDKVIRGVERHLPAVNEIMRWAERKATGKVISQLSQSGLNHLNRDKT